MIILKREPGGMPEYMTLHPDYNVGNQFAAWSGDPSLAFGFARRSDAEQFLRKFKHWFGHTIVSIGEVK